MPNLKASMQALGSNSAAVAKQNNFKNPSVDLSSASWRGAIDIVVGADGAIKTHNPQTCRSYLKQLNHFGPLRVQRPFYPEGAEICHVYLLHPPGGLVAGDQLLINLTIEEKAHGLFTNPSANKIYCTDGYRRPQTQVLTSQVHGDGVLEWFPNETIVFDNALSQQINYFNLSASAKLMGWDILCLGRPASNAEFCSGKILQSNRVVRQGLPLWIDNLQLDGESDLLHQPWGFNRNTVVGTFFATLDDNQQSNLQLEILRERFNIGYANRADITCYGENFQVHLSQMRSVLLARYLGNNAHQAKLIFIELWKLLRPMLLGREACEPRIWST